MGYFTVVIQLAVAVYLLYGAISGKNLAFSLRYPKEGKEAIYKKYVRIGIAVAGVLMLALGGCNLYANTLEVGNPALETLGSVVLVLSFLIVSLLLGVLVLRSVFTDKEKKLSAMTKGTAPRAAFYFDEEEK